MHVEIQLTIANYIHNFIASIVNDKEHVMHSKSDNIEVIMNVEEVEITF